MTARPGAFDLPHRAYIEALAEAPEGSPAWHAIVAGYAALQLFEAWLEGGLGETPPSAIEVQRIWRYVQAVPETCVERRCLTQLIDCIEATLAASLRFEDGCGPWSAGATIAKSASRVNSGQRERAGAHRGSLPSAPGGRLARVEGGCKTRGRAKLRLAGTSLGPLPHRSARRSAALITSPM